MRETRLWTLSLAAVLFILVLLGLHFAVMHYSPVFLGQGIEETRSLQAVLERGRDAVQMIIYILLLAAALYHGLYGLRGILRELPLSVGLGRAVDRAILIAGLLFFAYGTYVTWWTFSVKQVGG